MINCQIVKDNQGNIINVEAPNGNTSILYSELKNITNNQDAALNLWSYSYTDDFNEVEDYQKRDYNGEHLVSTVLNNITTTKVLESNSNLSKQDITEIQKTKALTLSDALYIDNLSNDIKDKIKVHLAQNKAENEINEVLSIKETPNQPFKELVGIKDRTTFDKKVQSISDTNFIDKYNSDIDFADTEFEKHSSLQKIEVFSEVNGELFQEYENDTYQDLINSLKPRKSNISIASSIEFLNEIAEEVWYENEVEIKQILKDIQTKTINLGIDTTNLLNDYEVKTRTEILSYLNSISSLTSLLYLNTYTDQDIRDFAEIHNQYNNIITTPKEQIILETEYSVAQINTSLNEKEMFDRFGYIKVEDNLYQKVDKTEDYLESLYELTLSEASSVNVVGDVDFTAKGGNKAVDKKGDPIILYRAGEIDTPIKNDKYTVGRFFTTVERAAEAFGKDVKKAAVTMKKPFIVDAKEAGYSNISVPKKMKDYVYGGMNTVDTDIIAEWAYKNGYDGVIIKNVYEGGSVAMKRDVYGYGVTPPLADNYIVFDVKQVKAIKQNFEQTTTTLPQQAFYPTAFTANNEFKAERVSKPENKEAIKNDIKRYLSSQIKEETSLEIVAYKIAFGHLDNRNETPKVNSSILNYIKEDISYLTGEFLSDLKIETLKEKLKDSVFYNKVLKHLEIGNKGITLKPTANLKEIEFYTPKNHKLIQYSYVSKDSQINTIFATKTISDLSETTPKILRNLYINNPTLIEKYKGEYVITDDNKVKILNKVDNFIKINSALLEKVGEKDGVTYYQPISGQYNEMFIIKDETLSSPGYYTPKETNITKDNLIKEYTPISKSEIEDISEEIDNC